MIPLPEIAKSYRREPIKRGFKAYVPGETARQREWRLLREQWERETGEDLAAQLEQYMLSNLVREIGLHRDEPLGHH